MVFCHLGRLHLGPAIPLTVSPVLRATPEHCPLLWLRAQLGT